MKFRGTADGVAEDAEGVSPDASAPDVARDSRGGEQDARSAAQAAAWDPYEVWLTRVKQPRDRRARSLVKPRATPASSAVDTSDTARLRALAPIVPR
jgi:hypothetical protein